MLVWLVVIHLFDAANPQLYITIHTIIVVHTRKKKHTINLWLIKFTTKDHWNKINFLQYCARFRVLSKWVFWIRLKPSSSGASIIFMIMILWSVLLFVSVLIFRCCSLQNPFNLRNCENQERTCAFFLKWISKTIRKLWIKQLQWYKCYLVSWTEAIEPHKKWCMHNRLFFNVCAVYFFLSVSLSLSLKKGTVQFCIVLPCLDNDVTGIVVITICCCRFVYVMGCISNSTQHINL